MRLILTILIILCVVWLLGRKRPERSKTMLFDKDRDIYAVEVVDSPLDITERSLISKRDRALEKAARRASLTWTDRRNLRKNLSQGLLELTRQTGEDIREALVAKLRSDLNLFVSAHEMKNLASLERLRLGFEEMLTEACTASSMRRAQAKASALMEMVERISAKHDELEKHCNGREAYKRQAEEAFGRIFEDTLRNIESLHVSLKGRRLFTD